VKVILAASKESFTRIGEDGALDLSNGIDTFKVVVRRRYCPDNVKEGRLVKPSSSDARRASAAAFRRSASSAGDGSS
jgi:hypothetical protein